MTSLLRAVSGSHLILCLKPTRITWSPEQNDSLGFFENYLQQQNVWPWAGRWDFFFFLNFFKKCNLGERKGELGGPRWVSALPGVVPCPCAGSGCGLGAALSLVPGRCHRAGLAGWLRLRAPGPLSPARADPSCRGEPLSTDLTHRGTSSQAEGMVHCADFSRAI